MAQLTPESVRALAKLRCGEGSAIVSCYLDVDGRRHPRPQDLAKSFQRLARTVPNGSGAKYGADLARMEQLVRSGVDRTRTRGLAMFSCHESGLWDVVELPVRVTDQLTVGPAPSVRQLERVLEEAGTVGVLLVDAKRADVAAVRLGVLLGRRSLVEPDERAVAGTAHGAGRDAPVRTRESARAAEARHQHAKRAAQLAAEFHGEHPIDHLVLGGPAELVADVEHHLHASLRPKVVAKVATAPGASADQLVRLALDAELAAERAREAAVVARLRDGVATGRGAVSGVKATLQALAERKVDTLVVSDGMVVEGWRCAHCGRLATLGRTCPTCGSVMSLVDDVIEAAVDEAFTQGCTVAVCVGNADLDVHGGIGALLRY